MEYERDFFELGSYDNNVNMIEEKAKENEEENIEIENQKNKYKENDFKKENIY